MEGHLLNCCLFSLLQAGMHAVRENRYIVLAKDFEKGYKNNIKKDESEHEFYKWTVLVCVALQLLIKKGEPDTVIFIQCLYR